MNLIMNAKDAVGKKGTISLSTQYNRSKRQVIIKVADNGCGIEKKNLSRIFDPFFTTKEKDQGTGLGLFIIKNIIEGHEGSIELSPVDGKGAEFRILLPII